MLRAKECRVLIKLQDYVNKVRLSAHLEQVVARVQAKVDPGSLLRTKV